MEGCFRSWLSLGTQRGEPAIESLANHRNLPAHELRHSAGRRRITPQGDDPVHHTAKIEHHTESRQLAIDSIISSQSEAGVGGFEDQRRNGIESESLCDLCNVTRPAQSGNGRERHHSHKQLAHESRGEEAAFKKDDLHPEPALWVWNPRQQQGKANATYDPDRGHP